MSSRSWWWRSPSTKSRSARAMRAAWRCVLPASSAIARTRLPPKLTPSRWYNGYRGSKMALAKAVALTIAGSDPSGGAGIQADLKTFHQFGVYREAVITLITVQNTRRVDRVEFLAPDLIVDQIRAVLDDIPPAAAMTGALGTCG